MAGFVGTHQNRIDAKGRVSIPASFRAALRNGEGPATVVLRRSHTQNCVEGWSEEAFQSLGAPLATLDLFSEEYEALAAIIYGDAHTTEADREGRIVLPANLSAHANLGDAVMFMGMGRFFQIWEPAAGEQRRSEARERARLGHMTLPGVALPGARAAAGPAAVAP